MRIADKEDRFLSYAGRTGLCIFVLLIVAWLAALCSADIIAPATVPEHTLVKIESTDDQDGDRDYGWLILGPRFFKTGMFEEWVQTSEAKRSIAFTGPPGRYVVILLAPTIQQAVVVIEGDAKPDPKPDPEPDPDPTPPPPDKLLAEMWLIVVEDNEKRTPEVARVLLDPTVRRWMTDNGHNLRIVDRDAQASDLQEWIDRATAQTDIALPCLFVVDDKGAVYSESELPGSWLLLLEVAKKWGAVK